VATSSSRSQDLSRLEIRVGFAKPGGGYGEQNVPLETYVARVLAGEAARESPPAALEALAIAIRTFAVVNRGRHNADGFDVCDQTHCQVVRTATPVTERATLATAGRVLMLRGVPMPIYYSASCGGRTLTIRRICRRSLTMRAEARRPGRPISMRPIWRVHSAPPDSAVSV
jgi:peptidoglycan hydrolase-like amidase